MAPKYLTNTLAVFLTSLTLTTTAQFNTTSYTNSTTSNSTSASTAASDSYSLASLSLPGGNAKPALTLYMYDDPDCSSEDDLVNVLPLSYNKSSPQYPFWGIMMTRDLAENETLTFYTSTNTSGDACAEMVGYLTGGDMGDQEDESSGAGTCWPVGGATCFNLTQG